MNRGRGNDKEEEEGERIKLGKGHEILKLEEDGQKGEEDAAKKGEVALKRLTMLKETCTFLDNQLKEFEGVVEGKNEEIQILREEKKVLETENSSLKKSLETLRSDLKESKALVMFYENRANLYKREVANVERQCSKKMECLETEVTEVKKKNSKLVTKLSEVTEQLETSRSARENALQIIEYLREANEKGTKKNQHYKDKNKTMAKEIEGMRAELSEILEIFEDYKERYETLSSHQTQVQQASANNEGDVEELVQLKSMVKQQNKLLDHLMEQNDVLMKKKKFSFFSLGKRSEPSTPRPVRRNNTSSSDSSDKNNEVENDPPQVMVEDLDLTPSKLAEEHLDVERLEKQANLLRNRLAELQEKAAVGAIFVSLRPTSKEECILLKDEEEEEGPNNNNNNNVLIE